MDTCTVCKFTLPIEDFVKSKQVRRGYVRTCKPCQREKSRKNREKDPRKSRDYHREYLRQWRSAMPEEKRIEYAKKQKTYKKAYTAKQTAEQKRRDDKHKKAWYEANKEAVVESARARRKENPAIHQRATAARRARKKAAGVFRITDKEILAIRKSPCANCGGKEDVTSDHIVPLVRGGRHSIGNLQPLCRKCNSSKNGKLQIEWRYAERK